MIQLIQPNFGASGRIGMCEAYAEAFFGVTIKEPSARAAWDAAKFKHPGEEPPGGVIVPMFWDYLNPENNFHNDGHVGAGLGDGRVQCSPWQAGTTHAVLNSRAELENIYSDNGTYPLTYLGWSEDISNVRVVKEIEMFTPEQVNKLVQATGNFPATDEQKSVYPTQTIDQVLDEILTSDWNVQLRTDAQAFRDQPKPGAVVTPVPADPNSVVVSKDGLWASFKKFLGL